MHAIPSTCFPGHRHLGLVLFACSYRSVPARLLCLLLLVAGIERQAKGQSITYSGPIVITTGGTYTGNWESLDSTVPAVNIQTTQPVIIENANLRSAGHLINITLAHNANVTVINCRGYGLLPSVDSRAHGRFVNARLPRNLVVENNLFENTSGIYVHGFYGDGTAGQSLSIRYNRARNINGKHRNGTSRTSVQFTQLNEVTGKANVEIAWNEIINEPGVSAVEDNISLYNSGGKATSPLLVHNNFIKGAYPPDPLTTPYSGGGIITDGNATGSAASAYVHAFQNVVVGTTNHGMAIAAGNNNHFFNNRVISSGLFPDGTRIPAQNVGIWMKNYYNTGADTWYDNIHRDNTIAWVKFGATTNGMTDRNDYTAPTWCENCPDNTLLPNPVTQDMEQQEHLNWLQRCRDAAVTVGLLNTTPQPLVVTVTSPANNASFKEGLAIELTASVTEVPQLAPVKGNGKKNEPAPADVPVKRVEYFRGSVKIGEAITDPYKVTWAGAPAGTHLVRAVATDEHWVTTTSEAITVTVVANQPPVVSAGDDQSIMLPTSTLTLQGSASDPDGSISAYLWTQQSGPAATLSGTTTATLSLSDLTEDTYVFRLTATDNEGATAFDEATVTVVPRQNQAPVVSLTAPADNSSHTQGTPITLTASASDADGQVTTVAFFQGADKLAEVTSSTSSFSFSWTGATLGTHTLTALATDNEGASTTSALVTITVVEPQTTPGPSGSILREYWANAPGARVSDIPLNKAPTSTNQLNLFEGPSNIANSYGTRIRGYVHPPVTGTYYFWIAGDDHCELWLSTDDTPERKVRIASHQGQTKSREWTKFSSQASGGIPLVAGQRYYIEALHKEDKATDNIAVGWQLPDNTLERPIPGNRLSPFVPTSTLSASSTSNVVSEAGWEAATGQATVFPNPSSDQTTLSFTASPDSPSAVSLFNITGQEVFRAKLPAGEKEIRLPLDLKELHLSPGVYLLRVQTGIRTEVLRVIKNQ